MIISIMLTDVILIYSLYYYSIFTSKFYFQLNCTIPAKINFKTMLKIIFYELSTDFVFISSFKGKASHGYQPFACILHWTFIQREMWKMGGALKRYSGAGWVVQAFNLRICETEADGFL